MSGRIFKPARRRLLAPAMMLALAAPATAAGAGPQSSSARVLVAYFSRTGNTRVIAHQIRRAQGATLFEIVPAQAYPEDYRETVELARHERDTGARPALRELVPDLARYRTVFLGFPIWGETAPPVIRSFLAAHDLSGKTIIPFVTHGGYGIGNALDVLAAHAPNARLTDRGLVMQADQERQTLERVTRWLGDVAAG